MKKIDKLVLTAFIPPLILTFFVIIFILLSRQMLYYFDDIIGKDLGVFVILQFILHLCVVMVPAAIPLSILLASIITFGNLAENFELTAIKAAGISLPRVLQPLFLLIVMITAIAFAVNNNIAPRAALEAYSLMYDIKQKKPALDIREGEFYNQLPGMSIRVNKKFAEDPAALKDVILYNHSTEDGNHDVMVADSGRMYTILNARYLKFEFFNGYQYADKQPPGQEQAVGDALTRRVFSRIETVVDLASFDIRRTDISLFESNRAMRNQRQLQGDIDSMKVVVARQDREFKRAPLFQFADRAVTTNDTLAARLPESAATITQLREATNKAREAREILSQRIASKDTSHRDLVLFEVQWHLIAANSVACIIMFLLGAPLGSIIRKGGIGLPFLLAVVLFILYTVIGMNGEKLAKQYLIAPQVGAWMSNAVMLAAGLYLLSVARRDARLFESNISLSLLKKVHSMLSQRRGG